MAVATTLYHVRAERNIYYLSAHPFLFNCFVYSYHCAIVCWNVAFIAISIGVGIPIIYRKTSLRASEPVSPSGEVNHRRLGCQNLWWIPVAVGTGLLYLNAIGYSFTGMSGKTQVPHHVWRWPIVFSSSGLDPYGGQMLLEFYFSYIWLIVDIVVSVVATACSVLVVKIAVRRPLPLRQFSVGELLIVMTSAAIAMPVIMREFNAACSPVPAFAFDIPDYCAHYPVFLLPAHWQMSIYLGLLSFALVCGTSFLWSLRYTILGAASLFRRQES